MANTASAVQLMLMTLINTEAMKKEELRKILKGKCISDESCEAAISELLNLFNVSEIQNSAKKELLNSYYVAIHYRKMSVEDIMQSIEADRQFLNGEMILDEAKNILNAR